MGEEHYGGSDNAAAVHVHRLNWLLAYLVAGSATRAHAQDPTMDIVKKMKEVFEPARSSLRTVVITATSERETVQGTTAQGALFAQGPEDCCPLTV